MTGLYVLLDRVLPEQVLVDVFVAAPIGLMLIGLIGVIRTWHGVS